jgi:predicted transcriptional regulator of viral defense system
MKQNLGSLETQLFAYAQMRRLRTLRRGELSRALQITPRQEAKLLSRLATAGLIARVWRGVYLVPPRLPLGGKWTPDEALALGALMEERKGRYQVCGPNAFRRYRFDNQVPNRVYAYNNRISGERTIGAVALSLIKVADGRLGETDEVRTSEGLPLVYSSRARTLLDAVYDWSRFDTLPRAYRWIRSELASGRVSASGLVRVTVRYGDVGTIRRMGALLEAEGAEPNLLRRLERALRPTRGLIPFVPRRPLRGKANRRWGVLLNANV